MCTSQLCCDHILYCHTYKLNDVINLFFELTIFSHSIKYSVQNEMFSCVLSMTSKMPECDIFYDFSVIRYL